MKKLILPKTINLLSEQESLKNGLDFEKLKQRFETSVVEGYQLAHPEAVQLFSFSAKVNVDNPRLWPLFEALSKLLPEPVCTIYGWKDDSEGIRFGRYDSYAALWKAVVPFEKAITEDGYLQFGLLHNTETELVEVFVTESKYIQFWGTDQGAFEQVMEKFGLPLIQQLEFVDEYPRETHALHVLEPNALYTQELIAIFDERL